MSNREPQIRGRVRESADGLRGRSRAASRKLQKQVQERVGREAARQREEKAGDARR